MTLFNTQYDQAHPFTNKSAQFGLNANTQLSFTVPGTDRTTYICNFKFPSNANVWVALNKNASTPTKNVMTSTSLLTMNPDSKFVRGGDVLNFLSDADVSDACLELFTQPGAG